MTASTNPTPGRPAPHRPDPQRRVPAWAAALLLAVTATALVLVALLAGRAGPLVAHPPTVQVTMPPPPTGTMSVTQQPSAMPTMQRSQPSGAWLWWVAAVLGGLIVLLVLLWLIRALRRPGRIAAPLVAAATAPMAPASLDWLGEDAAVDLTDGRTFDPHRAADDIIASWTALESAAAHGGHLRQPASTPTEFLHALTDRLGDPALAGADAERAAGDGLLGAPPAGGAWTAAVVLLRLYHRARFDTTALAPGAATAARAAVRTLLQAWDMPARGSHR